MSCLLIYPLVLCGTCEMFLPGNELSAMAESLVCFIGPLKLCLFYCRFRWQVTI